MAGEMRVVLSKGDVERLQKEHTNTLILPYECGKPLDEVVGTADIEHWVRAMPGNFTEQQVQTKVNAMRKRGWIYPMRDINGNLFSTKPPFAGLGGIIVGVEPYFRYKYSNKIVFKYSESGHLPNGQRWRSPITLPTGSARFVYTVSAAKVIRAHDLTNDHAIRAGFYDNWLEAFGAQFEPLGRLRDYWNAKYHDYDSNPFVWMLTLAKAGRWCLGYPPTKQED